MRAYDIIKERDEWHIIDSSKLREYMSCPRKYFFNNILGWTSVYPNNHFVFGSAWHVAMEHLLLNNYSPQSVTEAGKMLLERYRQELGPETDSMYGVKTPAAAFMALVHYYDRYKNDPDNYDVLYTEVGGRVKLGEEAVLAFKIDCIRQDRHTKEVEVLDHKTSQRKIAGWERIQSLSIQLMSYLHVLYSLKEFDKIKGGRIRCTFFYKGRQEFEEVRIRKTPQDMESFLTDALTWYDALRRDMYLLMETCSDDTWSMPAFPRNPESCYSYGKLCTYFDVCEAWPNPLTECHTVPEGFKVEFWNPLDDPRIRNEVDLT